MAAAITILALALAAAVGAGWIAADNCRLRREVRRLRRAPPTC